MLGDLGGLFGAMGPFCAILVSIFQYQSSYQFIMADLFLDRNKNDISDKGEERDTSNQNEFSQ